MRRLTHLLVLGAFIFSCGGHWYVLQGIAWVNMVREYSQVGPFTQAVQMTLSGQYHCSLCQAIAEKKQEENTKVALTFSSEKKICSPTLILAKRSPKITPQTFVIPQSHLLTRSEAPPTPPPRLA